MGVGAVVVEALLVVVVVVFVVAVEVDEGMTLVLDTAEDEDEVMGVVALPTLHHPSLLMMKSMLPFGWLCPPALSASARVWQNLKREQVRSVLPPYIEINDRKSVDKYRGC